MLTIYDIAKAVGCSAPTVSKALNGTGFLSPATREKIIRVAKEMGYKPNIVARTLATKKSKLIGIIYDDPGMNRGFGHPLYSDLLNIFRTTLEDSGYDLVFISSRNEMSYYEHCSHRSIDGLVIMNPAADKYNDIQELKEKNIPCVSTSVLIPGLCTVITDNERSGFEAAEYFIQRGHKKLAYLSAPTANISPAAVERFNGFKKGMEAYGLKFDEDLYELCENWQTKAGYEGFERLYKRNNDFTAVFVSSDLLAYGVMDYAKDNNISVPDEISIIGFDNERISAFRNPSLTTFSQDKQSLASMAAEMLIHTIYGIPTADVIRIPAMMIKRDSVKTIS